MKEQTISVEWLSENLSLNNLIILDASPTNTVGGKISPFKDYCIPNARLIDIKKQLTNKESDFPNTVPTASQFENVCQSLGINADSKIVVYDNLGIYTSPRVWWLFKFMGHEDVAVLDGGLPEWIKKGNATVHKTDLNQNYQTGNFKAEIDEKLVINYQDVVGNSSSNKFKIVDARSSGRFNGSADEPRKHLQSGSIPNSVNIPYPTLLENGKFKPSDEIRKIFADLVSDQDRLVFSCGSGLTACIVMLASEVAFKESRYLYDGSWTEYAELQNLTK